jgi:hypothetical protein
MVAASAESYNRGTTYGDPLEAPVNRFIRLASMRLFMAR